MDLPDLSIFRKFGKDSLTFHLLSCEGTKDLFLDEELMKPLDQISGGISYLREQGVNKVFKLQHGASELGADQRLFIVRPYADRMQIIAESIKNDKAKGVLRKYHIVLTPRRLAICDTILEREGVYGDVTIAEFPLEIIPLDNDVMSIEMPLLYRQFFLGNDTTWLHSLARVLHFVEGTFGNIPKGVCIGEKAKKLYNLTQLLSSSTNNTPSEIGSFIILDRVVDLVTPLLSQLVYEGLIAETFGIKTGIVEFGKEVTGDKSVSLLLKSSDQVFGEIRGMHITNVFPLLSQKSKQLQCGFEKRHDLDSVKDFKQFVSEDLGKLKQQQKSLATHIGACEHIMKLKKEEVFEDCLQVEQCLLDDSQTKGNISYIETNINKQSNPLICLRLLCLLSLCKGGLDSKLYKSLKTQYLHSFGYQHAVTFKNLKDSGLLTESSDRRNVFPKVRKKFNLIPKDPESIGKKDVAYVFGGAYIPFTVKLVEQILSKGFSPQLEETLKTLQISTFEHKQGVSVRQSSAKPLKTVLVVFLGGCTHTEINALRFIGKQLGYKFIMLTTCVITSKDLLSTLTAT